MIWESVVAQMLRAAGNKLFFHVSGGDHDGGSRMEIDFLIAKATLQRRHNIAPIEVKGTGEYETKSLDKFLKKYDAFLNEAFVIHTKNLDRGNRRTYLPAYMAQLVNQ